MSRAGRKKKSKRRQPAPNYRKQAREKARQAQQKSESGPAPAPASSSGPSTVVSLDPLAPIIVRSGRPLEGKADADPARFPPPSTLAGCLRTAWARAAGQSFGPYLAKLAVAGPLLLNHENKLLAPKPADALYFDDGGSARCVRAEPKAFDAECGADLPDRLLPVQLNTQVEGKSGDGPAWWSWDDLLDFRRGEKIEYAKLCKNGWSPPAGDRRTHVAIDPDTYAAKEGQLFQTEGLDLDVGPARHSECPQEQAHRQGLGALRLLVRFAEPLGEALVHLGGKRRLAALAPEYEDTWPVPPDGWLEQITGTGRLCLTLLTPAIFSAGYRPGWLDGDLTGSPPELPGLRLKLCAAAVERWQPHSGWDLHRRQPRPTRKLAGAGAVYWFRILGHANPDALGALWLSSVSDIDQDRRDGFGLALPGPWTPPPVRR